MQGASSLIPVGAWFTKGLSTATILLISGFDPMLSRFCHPLHLTDLIIQNSTKSKHCFRLRVGRNASRLRGDIKIGHSRMTKTCWETLVTCL